VGEFQKRNEHDGVVPPNNWESFFGDRMGMVPAAAVLLPQVL